MSRRVVWKYAVPIGPEVTLPINGHIVHVGVQGSWPMLWIETDPALPALLGGRTFRVFGTGERIQDEGWTHRGTVQDGAFVWHVYERMPS